ncbi:MAG: glycosyltransferase family 4 protein, partial [Proteobacteria bacterium]|nr:glycosyltransferase family 4 protein [Pseudomonadota bacterium]
QGGWRLRRMARRLGYEQTRLPRLARDFDLLVCIADMFPGLHRGVGVVFVNTLRIYDLRYYGDLRLRTLDVMARIGFRRADRILFPTAAAVDEVVKRTALPRHRLRVVPYGVSLDSFSGARPLETDTRYLLLPAALERHKNIETAIRAIAATRDSKLQLWIVGGDSTDPEHARELVRLAHRIGVADRVRFLGGVPHAEMASYFKGALALVFPSFIETFGFPLLEAMAAGTPIVASDIPVFREVAGEAAVYFPASDPEALAREVERVAQGGADVSARVEHGRERAQVFSWRRSVDELCLCFADVLGARGDEG